MDGKLVPFWEDAYGNEKETAFSAEPNGTLVEFEHLLNQNFKILEVGCGEGQNLLYLAKRGFKHLEAFDISEKGIGKLKRRCEVEEAKIDAYVADLTKFEFQKSYDLIMSFGTLHFVSREEWRKFLRDAKNYTSILVCLSICMRRIKSWQEGRKKFRGEKSPHLYYIVF